MNPMLEKMLPMLVKALGIEPDSLLQNLAQFQGAVAGKLAEFDARIRDIEAQGNRIEQKLDQLLSFQQVNHDEHDERFEHTTGDGTSFRLVERPANGAG